jgi:hypothetical protein
VRLDTEKVGSQVSIHKITSLSLRVILLLIGWITGSTTLHQASQAHMHCAIQCLEAHIFYWSTTMLMCMKRQLTECRQMYQQELWVRYHFVFLFFERVPSLSPREMVWGHVASFPAVCRWEALFAMTGWREDHRGLRRQIL